VPLPAGGNIPWPPKECEQIYAKYATWAAWYSGDIDQLQGIYAGESGARDTNGFFASETGGFKAAAASALSTVRRWFWGNRATGNRTARGRLHVPIAAEIAAASADLLFSEPPKVTVPGATGADGKEIVDAVTQGRLDELMDDGTHATLLEAAEIAAALGGVFLRIVWDKSKRDCPWLTAVHPDAAVPTWRWGDLDSVVFWKVIYTKGKTVVRHLECHEPGKILHAVYQGDSDTLGMPASLSDYPETAGLAEYLTDGNTILTGATGLTAVYVPNMRPNRIWRNTPTAAHLGRSDYAGVEPLLDALDMVYSSWMRDVELGKARLIVPQEYLRSNGPGQGASVDLDQEIYEGINVMGSEQGRTEITEVQFEIRVEQHQATCADLKKTIVGTAGYSAGTFGLDGEGQAKTATEIAAETRRSLITRDRKTRYFKPKLGDITEAWLEVDAYVFKSGVTPVRPQITWADAVSVDPLAQAQELNYLEQATAISTEQKVKRLNPDWTQDEVDAEVKKILDEKNGPPLADPGAELGPPNGPTPPGQQDAGGNPIGG
jgi:A118 family predicted phage portal protein